MLNYISKLKNLKIYKPVKNIQPRAIVAVAVVVVGTITLAVTRAVISNISLEVESNAPSQMIISSANASGGKAVRFGINSTYNGECGKRLSPFSYQVPYANAIWNQPICNQPRHAKSADYVERFFKWGTLNNGEPSAEANYGTLRTVLGLPRAPTPTNPTGLKHIFNTSLYYASEANTEKRVQTRGLSNLDGIKSQYSSDSDRLSYKPTAKIPWNSSWRSGEGGDNGFIILDDSNGRIYELGEVRTDPAESTAFCGLLWEPSRLCAQMVKVGRDMDGNIIDYRTYEGFTDGRGAGLSKLAMFTLPEEVLAGEIRHALGVSIPNTSTGPVCTTGQQGTVSEGYTCGTAWAPATKFEWGAITDVTQRGTDAKYKDTYTLDKLIPEGMRFALDMSESEIDAWIKAQPRFAGKPEKSKTAKVFAMALRDYGFIIVDTNGSSPNIQMSGSANPRVKDLWAQAGLDSEDDSRLLEGLIKQDKLYVVEPPTITCKDDQGASYTTKYACKWTNATY